MLCLESPPQESGVVITGDCVLGCGSTVFEDLREYLTSLRRLRGIMAASQHNLRSSSSSSSHSASAATPPAEEEASSFASTDSQVVSSVSIDTIYPGHGPVIHSGGLAKVDEYIRHRELRDRQILDFLETVARRQQHAQQQPQGHSAAAAPVWVSSWSVMCAVYADSLKSMPLTIRLAAQNSAVHHLEKLVAERRVKFCWPDLYRVDVANT
jgi:hypothetical protein